MSQGLREGEGRVKISGLPFSRQALELKQLFRRFLEPDELLRRAPAGRSIRLQKTPEGGAVTSADHLWPLSCTFHGVHSMKPAYDT